MAINWAKIIPRWAGEVIEPPEAKKTEGWKSGNVPPAKWANWYQKGMSEAVTENRAKIDIHDNIIQDHTLAIEENATAIEVNTSQLAQKATQADLEATIQTIDLKMDKSTMDIYVSQINKNGGLIDQSYLSPELIQQIAGTAPVNSVIAPKSITKVKFADNSVTPESAAFIKKSSNIFNIKTVTKGFAILSNGTVTANAEYSISETIVVNPSTSYYFYGMLNVAFYDQNNQFISRADLLPAGASVITPASAYFIRVNYKHDIVYSGRRINVGSALLPFEEFYIQLNDVDVVKLPVNVIETVNIKDDSVTPSKVSFARNSTNLYNKENDIVGFNISSADGSLVANNQYNTSEFIVATPSSQYSYYGFNVVAYYNASKQFISRVYLTYQGFTDTSPANTAFMRVHYQPNNAPIDVNGNERRINKSSELLAYEQFVEYLDGLLLSQVHIDQIKQDEEIQKIFYSAKSVRFDTPIDGVFNTSEIYNSAEYSGFGSATPHTVVYGWYDALLTAYPDYITKNILGYDSWGNIIAVYKFKPTRPLASINTKIAKVFITSGTHGYEHVPGLITYLFFKQMCEKWDEYPHLETLRHNVEFLVIPVVNPSGWDDYTRTNRNGVDINRNFPEGWVLGTEGTVTYGGATPLSELETQYVKKVFDDNPDIDICYDFHNFSGTSSTTDFIWIPTGSGTTVQNMAQILISRLTRKWRKEYLWIPDNYFAGYTDATHGAMVQDHAFARGIKYSATFEVCGKWHIDPSATPYDQIHKKTAVEGLVNWLLINLIELSKQ